MNISKVTIEQILDAREARAEKQRRFISEYGLPLICFTMNIAGEIKNSPLIEFAFMHGVNVLDGMDIDIVKKETESESTGCCAYYAVAADSDALKELAVSIEESFPAARLFDIDVISKEGVKLSRKAERKCLICENRAAICARSRAHSLEAVEAKTQALLMELASKVLAEYAYSALIYEVETTPKAGLVDKNNSGAHKDMDIALFKKSACALLPCFEKFVMLGMENHGAELNAFLDMLKKEGIEAENTMFGATDNINTHKGIVYSFALLLADAGRILMGEESAFTLLAAMDSDKARSTSSADETHGGMQYKLLGAEGIRGEAKNGFAHAFSAAELLTENDDENEGRALALVKIMETLEDTNVLHRGGKEALEYMHERAKEISSLPESKRMDAIYALDGEFIRRNLSPGGCADTLAIAIFIDLLRRKHYYLFHTFIKGREYNG